jgi:hypothetical protein
MEEISKSANIVEERNRPSSDEWKLTWMHDYIESGVLDVRLN